MRVLFALLVLAPLALAGDEWSSQPYVAAPLVVDACGVPPVFCFDVPPGALQVTVILNDVSTQSPAALIEWVTPSDTPPRDDVLCTDDGDFLAPPLATTLRVVVDSVRAPAACLEQGLAGRTVVAGETSAGFYAG